MTDRGPLGELHPFLKLLLLGMLSLAGLLVVVFLGLLLSMPFVGTDILKQLSALNEHINMLRYVQLLSHLGLFIVPAFVFAFLVHRKPLQYYRAASVPSFKMLIPAALIIVAVVPLVFNLTQINQQLSLPESLSGLEDWMRRTEDETERVMERFLNVTSIQAYLFNILLIAVIPGIGEELIFRGAMQRIFRQWTGSAHVAVIVTAIIFSAIHFQFFSFLPRLLLGIMLGYMFVISGNIWVPVFAHFFNNAMAVTMYYIAYNSEGLDQEALTGSFFPAVLVIISALLVGALFFFMKRQKDKAPQHLQ